MDLTIADYATAGITLFLKMKVWRMMAVVIYRKKALE